MRYMTYDYIYALPPIHLYDDANNKHKQELLRSPYRVEKHIKRSKVIVYSLLYAESIGSPISLTEYFKLNALYDAVIHSDTILKYAYTFKRLPEIDVMGAAIINKKGKKIKIKDFYKYLSKDFLKTEFVETKVIF